MSLFWRSFISFSKYVAVAQSCSQSLCHLLSPVPLPHRQLYSLESFFSFKINLINVPLCYITVLPVRFLFHIFALPHQANDCWGISPSAVRADLLRSKAARMTSLEGFLGSIPCLLSGCLKVSDGTLKAKSACTES